MKFTVYKDSKKQYRWRLKSKNGRIIADCGEGYTTKRKCLRGIVLVLNVGTTAFEIMDETWEGA